MAIARLIGVGSLACVLLGCGSGDGGSGDGSDQDGEGVAGAADDDESLTSYTWTVISYETGGIERIEVAEGCLADDQYTFEAGGVARYSPGSVACPADSVGIFPHASEGTWERDADGWLNMAFQSTSQADCSLSFSAHPSGAPTLVLGFSAPCTNNVAMMELRPD